MEQSYKEKYEQALAKAKEQYNYPCMRSCMGILEEIFPELKESEDEKIRKELTKHLKELSDWKEDEVIPVKNPSYYRQWATWLEKQGDYANFRDKAQVGDRITKNEDVLEQKYMGSYKTTTEVYNGKSKSKIKV